MNTPSPGLLRKALKIVDEIEKLDQQMHRLLSNLEIKEGALVKSGVALTRMTEEALSHLSCTAPAAKEKKEKISQGKITSPAASEKKIDLPPSLAVPQHEQQSLLMEDSGIEQLAVVESNPFETKEESSEQSCCLF